MTKRKKRKPKQKFWYVVVSADQFELPSIVENDRHSLAARLGIKPDSVSAYISKGTTFHFDGINSKIIRVPLQIKKKVKA